MYPKNKYLLPYSSLLFTKGFSRSLVIDTDRNEMRLIPNSLLDYIKILKKKTKQEARELFNNDLFIKEYETFLLENDFAFTCDNIESFPDLNLKWETPEKITEIHAIVKSEEFLANLIFFFNEVNVRKLLIEINDTDFNFNLFKSLNYNRIKSIELKISCKVENSVIDQLSKVNRITKILLNEKFGQIKNLSHVVGYFNDASIHFTLKLEHYCESLDYNTFYNKKIFIDENGYVKSSLDGLKKNIKIDNLKNAVDLIELIYQKTDFKDLWESSKNKIDICKNCEFRNICLDKRKPIKRNSKEWFYETECDYNPFINTWKNEKHHQSLAQCGIESNETGFVLDKKKINSINNQIWE